MNADRQAGPLDIDDRLRETLARYRARMALSSAAVLPLDAVRDVEQQLGTRLDDRVLALLAAAGRDPYQVLVLTEDAREGHSLPDRFVAFGHEPGSRSYWSVQRDAPTDEPLQVFQWSEQHVDVTARWPALDTFLRRQFDLDRQLSSAERMQVSRELGYLQPALVSPADETEPRRVYHPIFGVGVVLHETPGKPPKLDVDFGPAGRRRILSSFVRDVEAAPGEGDGDASPPDRSPAAA